MDLKYLNYSFELPYKMAWALKYLNLHMIEPKTILDIATGPGWFPLIATHFNHNVQCSDMPSPLSEAVQMFEEILHCLKLKKDFSFYINPSQKIPEEVGRYDIITALGMAFHHGWNLKNWFFFLDDIIHNHLKKGVITTIFFQANRNTAWEILEKDDKYQKRPYIKKWEMFENHMLKISVKL
jgi:hypothetical protein